MKKLTERNEEQQGWKPSARDAQDLAEKLKSYSKRKVNGRMQYPFDLYCEDKGYISFNQFGDIQVINPLQYHRASETNSLREWIDAKEMERLFIQFPEEKAAYEEKVMGWKMDCRSVIEKFRKQTTL